MKPDGTQVWLGEWSAVHEALFMATGVLDFAPNADASPIVLPASPPSNRVRAFVVDRLLQIMDEFGSTGRSKGEIVGADADGIFRGVTPGLPGNILVQDPEAVSGLSWIPAEILVSNVQGQYQFGSLLVYAGEGPVVASEIQYTKVYLTQGTVLTTMSVFRTTGGSGARFVNLGIYDQVDPTDPAGVPNDKLEETGATITTGTNSYITPSLASPVTISTTGFYWLAFITDTATPLRFSQTPAAYPPNFLPIRREVGAGTTLPATASGLSNPASAVVFVGAQE